ncbi:MAG: hypothetical protein JSS39_06450 [Nitrospira sp.]|nr:hypothetical protein [Nitrospira sp.]
MLSASTEFFRSLLGVGESHLAPISQKGCRIVHIQGIRSLKQPGDEVFIPKGVCHSVKNISPSTTRRLHGYD